MKNKYYFKIIFLPNDFANPLIEWQRTISKRFGSPTFNDLILKKQKASLPPHCGGKSFGKEYRVIYEN